MPRAIDYYYSLLSPWAYLGHAPFMDIVRRHGCSVNHKPVSLGQVFAETGGVPLARRHPARQRYRLVELQRWRDRRGVRLRLQPKHWPFEHALADRFVIAIVGARKDPDAFLRRAFVGIWEQERDLADPLVIAELAEAAGLEAAPLMDAARGDTTASLYAQNAESAVAADVFGSPSYVLEGEVFWGQDRLDLLDEALASGRPPFRPAS